MSLGKHCSCTAHLIRLSIGGLHIWIYIFDISFKVRDVSWEAGMGTSIALVCNLTCYNHVETFSKVQRLHLDAHASSSVSRKTTLSRKSAMTSFPQQKVFNSRSEDLQVHGKSQVKSQTQITATKALFAFRRSSIDSALISTSASPQAFATSWACMPNNSK